MSMEMMKALVVESRQKLVYKEIPKPQIAGGQVLIRVRACGICGSDVPRAKDGGVHQFPIVIGHEFSGEVAQVGAQVADIAVGDRVTAAPLVPCGGCGNCATGHPAMCGRYSFIGSRENGAMAEYVAVPAQNVVKVADSVSFEQAACIEPLTVAIHGVERAGALRGGKSAIVYGCGTIGILVMQCLRAKGIERVYVVDIDDAKLRLAKELGAYEALNPQCEDVPTYFEARGKADYVFETAGVHFIQSQVLSLVKKMGTVVYIGTAHQDVTIPAKTFEHILRGELKVTGSWMSYSAPFPGAEWTAAAEYLASGKVKVDQLVTHRFRLEDGYKAFEAMLDRNENSLKVMYLL